MNKQTTFETIVLWVNSSVTEDHLDLCSNASFTFLLERYGAEKEHNIIMDAIEKKKAIPSFVLDGGAPSAHQIHECKVCGMQFQNSEDLYIHYDESHNKN